MDMVSESGAITDVNEIAAALGLTPEVIKAEDEAIMATSLEDLLEAINQTEEMVAGEDVDIDVLTPAMESILNIANEIQSAGAISRADAITLRQMTTSLEGFQDLFATMPMNSFTEMPSKVNFDASMEGIFGDIGRKIIEAIKNIIKWIREKARIIWNAISGNRIKAKKLEVAAAKVTTELKKVETPETGAVYKLDVYINENVQKLFDSFTNTLSFMSSVEGVYGVMCDICIRDFDAEGALNQTVIEKFRRHIKQIGKTLLDVDISDKISGNKKSEILLNVLNCLKELSASVSTRSDNKVNISGMNPPRYIEKLLDNAKKSGLTETGRIIRFRGFVANKVEETRTSTEKKISGIRHDNADFSQEYETMQIVRHMTSIVDALDRLHGFYLSQYAELAKVGVTVLTLSKEAQA